MKKKYTKIIIDVDTLPIKEVISFIKERPDIKIHLITQYDTNIYANADKSIQISNYPNHYDFDKLQKLSYSPNDIWEKLINDHQTLMLYDRQSYIPKNTNTKIYEIIKICISCQQFLEKEEPNFLFFIGSSRGTDSSRR